MNENKQPGGETPAGGIPAPFLPGRCPRCGAELRDGGPFCFFCGLRVPEKDAWMEREWAPAGPETVAAPQRQGMTPPKAPFSASWREILAALAVYVLAWWYLYRSNLLLGGSGEAPERLWALAFTLGFVGLAELLHWGTGRPRESWIWLGCMGLITAGMLLHRHQVWDQGQCSLFLHLAAVYWVLCRSGRLLEGESGHLLPLDGLNGLVIFPFKHFYLRIRCLIHALARPFRSRRMPRGVTVLWSALAGLIALGLFLAAGGLLIRADAGFAKLTEDVAEWFRFDWDLSEFFPRLLLSLPVGQYLFGLLAGTGREKPEKLRERGEGVCRALTELRRVPNIVWTGLLGAFCLLYLVFFAVQSRYLFGAFTRTLPEGFIVSQYAREGFFELCKVMAVNFVLLWLVTRLCRVPVRENRPALILCLILLGESLLFAVVAFSKLALYIDCFGFTPLRLQSSWLVCVLFLGSLAAGWTLVTGKKTLRLWMIVSAVSLSLLCLV